jgi:DNA polymerase-4
MTFRRNISGEEEIRAGLSSIVDSVAARLREENCKCTVVQVQIKKPDFRVVQKQTSLKRATWLRRDLMDTAMSLVRQAGGYGTMIRSLTVTASGLVSSDETEEQLDIFSMGEEADDRFEHVEETMHQIRARFGKQSIRLGCYAPLDGDGDGAESP